MICLLFFSLGKIIFKDTRLNYRIFLLDIDSVIVVSSSNRKLRDSIDLIDHVGGNINFMFINYLLNRQLIKTFWFNALEIDVTRSVLFFFPG